MDTRTDEAESITLAPGEGHRNPSIGITQKATGEATRGAWSLQENMMPPGIHVPAHTHGNEEEAWYVLDGTLVFRIDDRDFVAEAGAFVLVPRGAVHGFGNATQEPARYLQIFSPSGFERYFEERSALAAAVAEGAKDYAGLGEEAHAKLAAKYGMEFV